MLPGLQMLYPMHSCKKKKNLNSRAAICNKAAQIFPPYQVMRSEYTSASHSYFSLQHGFMPIKHLILYVAWINDSLTQPIKSTEFEKLLLYKKK